MLIRNNPDPRGGFQRSGYIRTLAVLTLSQLRTHYFWAAECHQEADSEEGRAAATLIAKLIETIAKYRFGDQWLRP